MGLLERWDLHNQSVMDRARTGDVAGWTIGSVLVIAFSALYIVGDLPRPAALAGTALVFVAAIVGVVRIVRRRRTPVSSDTGVTGKPANASARRPAGSQHAHDADLTLGDEP